MNKNKKKIALILLLTLITVSFYSFTLSAAVQGEIKDMNFKGADIRDVLRAIAEVAGVNLVTDSSVTGNITIHLREISFDEALNLITQTTGLAYKWDGNTVVVATPQRIEEVYTEQNIEIVQFDNKNLERVRSVVSSIYPELNIQITRENTEILLVGKREDINGALNLIDRVDFPDVVSEEEEETQEQQQQAAAVIEIVKIEHGNLGEIVNNIRTLYPELTVQTDTNNDQMILKGQQEIIGEAKDLTSKLDIPSEEQIEAAEEESEEEIAEQREVTEFVKIENISSDELISKIKNIYPDVKLSYDQINQQLIIRGTEEEVEDTLVLVNRFDNEMEKRTEIVNVDYVEIENVNEIVGNNIPEVNLNTNSLTNEIIVSGNVKDVERAVNLIKNIDIPRRQVIIEARVEEISRTASESLGISDPTNNLPRIKFTKDSDDQINGITGSWPELLTALESKGEAETLANPRLMTLNGENGKMLIGERIPVKGVTGDGEVTITYIEAGITLDFQPWITNDNFIELQISPKVSSLGEELYEGYPSIRTREVTTKLRLRDGQTFAIGGLIQEDMKSSVNKVPILSEIPILGHLFKYNNESDEKTELVIFITPRIVEDDQVAEVRNNTPSLNTKTTTNQVMQNDDEVTEEETNNDDAVEEESSTTESSSETETTEVETQNEETTTATTESFNSLSQEELQEVLNSSRKTRDYGEDIPNNLNILYTVQADQSIQDIAYKYGISAEKIAMANNNKTSFERGETITLPIPGSHLVRIKEDQSIQSIIDEYKVTLQQILELNQLKSVDEIKSDMLLVLPKEIR